MNTNKLSSVQDFFRELVESQKPPALDTVLHDLTRIIAADGIGVCVVEGVATRLTCSSLPVPPTQFPWQTDADLLLRAGTCLRAETVEDASGVWLVSFVGVAGDGHLVWAYRSAQQSFSDADRWAWFYASAALVRWRTQAAPPTDPLQRDLEHAAVVTGRLTHDFGNYLTGIMGFTELSLSQVPGDGLLRRYMQEVLQSARQGAEWVRRLHLFCRRGFTPSWPTPLSCVLVEEEARLRSAGVQGLRWVSDVPHDLPLLDIESGALQTILTELVNNAREAAKGEGTITFTARPVELTQADCSTLLGSAQPGRHVEVTVSDDGPGIAPDDHARLFREMFFSTKPRHRGLGLLAVYGIVQRFRAGVRVLASAGRGATVQLVLPSAEIEGTAPAAADAPHLLLVNANPLLFESLRKILESHGFKVSVATSHAMALSTYITPGQSFALVLTDVRLPQLSGCDLARRILDNDAKASFLFLHTQPAFHGLAEEELLKRFPQLRWPLEPQALLQAVRTALAQRKTS